MNKYNNRRLNKLRADQRNNDDGKAWAICKVSDL